VQRLYLLQWKPSASALTTECLPYAETALQHAWLQCAGPDLAIPKEPSPGVLRTQDPTKESAILNSNYPSATKETVQPRA
jgi:hypothetical protein